MLRDQTKDKGKQPSVEPVDRENAGSSGERGGKLAPTTSNGRLSSPFISGFSVQQVSDITSFVLGMILAEWDRKSDLLTVELDRRFDQLEAIHSGRFNQRSDQSSDQLANQQSDSLQQATPQHLSSSLLAQATTTTTKPEIWPENAGYFDPGYQNEKEHGATSNGPAVNAGKHVYYRNVYVFYVLVGRLKDPARQRDGFKLRNVVTECLRGSALMRYSTELTELERDLLRDSDLDRWYTTLINRFKIRTSVALAQLVHHSYGMQDLRKKQASQGVCSGDAPLSQQLMSKTINSS